MEESREIQTHLKMAIVKLCQPTLIALLRKQLAPRDKFKLSSFELLYVDPGLKKGKLNSLEMEQLMYAPQVGETMKVLTDYGTR